MIKQLREILFSVFKDMVISHILNEPKVGFDGEGLHNSFIIFERIANKKCIQKDEWVIAAQQLK